MIGNSVENNEEIKVPETSSEDLILNSLKHNEVARLLSAVQGFSNVTFFAQGLNRLLRNYVRKGKMPGPSYYKIPFHKELTLLLFAMATMNKNLFSQITEIKLEESKKDSEQLFAVTLGRFLVVRLQELKDKVYKSSNGSTFERNMLMVVSYTLFSLSSQPTLIQSWSLAKVGTNSLIDRIVIIICEIINEGKEETKPDGLSLLSNDVNCIYDILTGTFFNM